MNHDYINESNLIDQYVLGKLAAVEAEEFEDHFIDCPACVERLNITRSLVQDLKDLAVEETLLSGGRTAEPTAGTWHPQQLVSRRSWAVVAGCCIVVAGVFALLAIRRLTKLEAQLRQAQEEASSIRQDYQQELAAAAESEKNHQETKQQLTQRLDELEQKLKTEGAANQSPVRGSEAPEVNFPIYALVSAVRGQVPTPVEIAPPGPSSRIALSIPVEDRRDFSVFRVTIVDHRGATVWKQSGFRPDAYHALSMSLKSHFLASGTYDLRVEGQDSSNQWITIGTYPFRFTRQ